MTSTTTVFKPSLSRHHWLIISFVPVVIFVLFADSRWLYDHGYNLQWLANLAGPAYLALQLLALRPEQRLMPLIFVPFSALGEAVFSLLFGLYTYKFGEIPIYVPFGHAILFTTGILISELPSVIANEKLIQRALLALHGGLILGAIIFLGDTLSLIFSVFLVWIMYRKRANNFYLIMGVLVLYIEMIGTWMGCWHWHRHIHGLQTTNPPMAAFTCYLIADIIVMKLARRAAPYLKPIQHYITTSLQKNL